MSTNKPTPLPPGFGHGSIGEFRCGDKPFGSVTTVYRNFVRGRKDGEVRVPCGSCNACCRSSSLCVELTPQEVEEHAGNVVMNDDGQPTLAKKEDGHCIKLIDGKCSIYNHRPFVCRTYDCRMMILHGRIDGYTDGVMWEAVQQWDMPRTPTVEDKDTWTALKMSSARGCSFAEGLEMARRLRRKTEDVA
jgi:Fe-S-cluster containining protein